MYLPNNYVMTMIDNDCQLCFARSFASHPKSGCLLDKSINPRKMINGNNTKYDFKCDICQHTFRLTICHVKRGVWCGYCSVPPKTICNCDICYVRSFASNPKSKFLADKTIDPRIICIQSDRKYLFKCDICLHEFDKPISSITSKNNPSWCPYCVNQKLCDCDICFYKSFASHPKSQYIVDKTIEINKITIASGKKLEFECDLCLSWFTSAVYHVTSINNPRWCPFCKNKSEKLLHEYLIKIFPDLIYQYKAEWCKKRNYLPFDICIPSLNIIIELDGRQHFMQVRNWGNPTQNQSTDKYKMLCAVQNGYSVIRLQQEDLFYNKIDWKNELNKFIKKYETPVIIFIDKNNIYKDHVDEKLKQYILSTI